VTFYSTLLTGISANSFTANIDKSHVTFQYPTRLTGLEFPVRRLAHSFSAENPEVFCRIPTCLRPSEGLWKHSPFTLLTGISANSFTANIDKSYVTFQYPTRLTGLEFPVRRLAHSFSAENPEVFCRIPTCLRPSEGFLGDSSFYPSDGLCT
jgi:hypothetical protein